MRIFLIFAVSHDLEFKKQSFLNQGINELQLMKNIKEHGYIPPSGLLETIGLQTHDFEMILTETLNLGNPRPRLGIYTRQNCNK